MSVKVRGGADVKFETSVGLENEFRAGQGCGVKSFVNKSKPESEKLGKGVYLKSEVLSLIGETTSCKLQKCMNVHRLGVEAGRGKTKIIVCNINIS